MKNLLLCAALVTSGGVVIGSSSTQAVHVFVGTIEYVEPRNLQDFERDKALYAHDNAQYVVIHVDRSLTEHFPVQRAVVRIAVDDPSATGVKWFTRSYGVLDPSIWQLGAKIIVVPISDNRSAEKCIPLSAPRPMEDSDPSLGEKLGTSGDDLLRFSNEPLFCTSVRNVFFLREER